MGQSITAEDIVAALGRTTRFPAGTEQFDALSPHIGHLVEVIGAEHMDDRVCLSSLLGATGRYIEWLSGNNEFIASLGLMEGPMVAMLYGQLATQIEAVVDNLDEVLAQQGVTEQEAMVGQDSPLDDASKELYLRGELTFATLLSNSPDIFIPQAA